MFKTIVITAMLRYIFTRTVKLRHYSINYYLYYILAILTVFVLKTEIADLY